MPTLSQILAAILKEVRLVVRDLEALGVLFAMPVAFVLIMSLALRDAFDAEAGVTFPALLVDRDGGRVGAALEERLSQQAGLELQVARSSSASPAEDARIRDEVRAGRYRFAVIVPEGASHDAEARAAALTRPASAGAPPGAVSLELLADPAVRAEHRALVVSSLNLGLAGLSSELMAERLRASMPGGPAGEPITPALFEPLEDPYRAPPDEAQPTPTAVQQNAPGWGVLAMFFLVVPLAGTLVREHNEGSLRRLRTMAAPVWLVLAGKAVPYFVINQIQMGLILIVGRYLVPLLGGDRLELGSEYGALIGLSVAVSVAAIGYGLAVASFCRTTEQSTTFGAASILILGAIGGVMVPKMVMPVAMQAWTRISPMSWGLDGFPGRAGAWPGSGGRAHRAGRPAGLRSGLHGPRSVAVSAAPAGWVIRIRIEAQRCVTPQGNPSVAT